ncbi:hypothetical protein AABD41_15005 [Staphylococcus pseudoxylosus]|uniref:hypothetical protein n=1 Tax=Staphylococcus pseudoxylosus TaxID=2282419 RepID=UPI00398B43D4
MGNEPILKIITDIKALEIKTNDENEKEEFENYKYRAMYNLFSMYADCQEEREGEEQTK